MSKDPTGCDRSGIVVGIDGSSGSKRAAVWATARTKQFGNLQPVTTWHYPWWMVPNPVPGAPIPPQAEQFQNEADALAERELAALDITEYETPIVRRGAAGPMLVSVGQTSSLIVVGTRGRGPAADTLLGSVSSHVAAHASVPVAIVPDNTAIGPHPSTTNRRVVVGIDGSENSIAALVWAINTTPDDVVLEAAHVWHYSLSELPETGPIPSELFELQAQQILDETVIAATVAAGGTRGRIIHRLEYGDPRNVLRDISPDADHLVLGRQGHHGVAHLILGSITSGLIHQPLTTTIVTPAARRLRISEE